VTFITEFADDVQPEIVNIPGRVRDEGYFGLRVQLEGLIELIN
jgi:hypothetical protein